MAGIAEVLAAEFGDLSMAEAVRLAIRLVIAGTIGGLLGWERERAGKAAGFRTHILVAIGTAAMVAVPSQAGFGSDPVSRVIQGLMTGIGFIGAGCILKPEGKGTVRGLTTAAGIWLTAAVGITAGMGRELSALLIGGLGWFVLAILWRWETRIIGPRDEEGS
ncbi:MAG TPA: MgtC/SapB family protein [Fimbriiglobus sp.]|jgi:putative Mg2+ transporter-C (MgtC) family protein|nr:MgtC/SapB family protein [Fimbriiglobus sp.]